MSSNPTLDVPPPSYSAQPRTNISNLSPLLNLPIHQEHQYIHSIRNDEIPLLPLTTTSPHVNPRITRSLRRAIEDFQRSSCPSHWSMYRHGKRLISEEPDEEEDKLIRWVSWFVGLFDPMKDCIGVNRVRSGSNLGLLNTINPYAAY